MQDLVHRSYLWAKYWPWWVSIQEVVQMGDNQNFCDSLIADIPLWLILQLGTPFTQENDLQMMGKLHIYVSLRDGNL